MIRNSNASDLVASSLTSATDWNMRRCACISTCHILLLCLSELRRPFTHLWLLKRRSSRLIHRLLICHLRAWTRSLSQRNLSIGRCHSKKLLSALSMLSGHWVLVQIQLWERLHCEDAVSRLSYFDVESKTGRKWRSLDLAYSDRWLCGSTVDGQSERAVSESSSSPVSYLKPSPTDAYEARALVRI